MSPNQPEISVVISTYNRCGLLAVALESLLKQETAGVRFEVVVVDNNSSDNTRDTIESFVKRSDGLIRYVFEGKQGLSYGWNTGISSSRAPIIAFTDDDQFVPGNWVANIKRAYDEHPNVAFIGFRVLPVWEAEPPSWLTRELWAPLALQDETEEFYTGPDRPVCLIGKSFRREAFEVAGLFVPELGRIKDAIGSLEDEEIQRRMWKHGLVGMFVPSIAVHSPVEPARMTKAYYRRWHTGHGRHYALMREEGFERSRATLFGSPVHIFRQAFVNALGWAGNMVRFNPDRAFAHEIRLRFFWGFFYERRGQRLRGQSATETLHENGQQPPVQNDERGNPDTVASGGAA